MKFNLQQKLTQQRSNHLLTGSIIAILIGITPFIFYSYMCFPNVKVWETPFFTYTSKYYENVETFMWVFLQKFIFLYLMVIWFCTSKDWWHKAILIPIGMIAYQIINLLNDELKFKDEYLDAIVLVPLVVIICFSLIMLRNKLALFIPILDLKEQIDIATKKALEEIGKGNDND
jgi:hypothetical protein